MPLLNHLVSISRKPQFKRLLSYFSTNIIIVYLPGIGGFLMASYTIKSQPVFLNERIQWIFINFEHVPPSNKKCLDFKYINLTVEEALRRLNVTIKSKNSSCIRTRHKLEQRKLVQLNLPVYQSRRSYALFAFTSYFYFNN